MKPGTEIRKTEDGSHTLFVKELNEHYHSTHGAITESHHVFIEAGLRAIESPALSILEIGFGTGLNVYLTLLEAIKNNIKIEYTGIEKYPLPTTIINSLNYNSLISGTHDVLFKALHESPWNEKKEIASGFVLNKIHCDLLEVQLEDEFNLVYFDAFAPDKQPELWSKEVFAMMHNSMKPGGFLVTYSSKGRIRRNMEAAGFKVEKLPGPPGKRDMTRALR